MSELSYIKEIKIKKLWGQKNLCWSNIHPDVNVLVGINGSGKTTLLNMTDAYYKQDAKELKRYKGSIDCTPANTQVYPITYIRSYDVPVGDRRKTESPLMQELNNVVFQNKEGISFFNYRMKMLDFKSQAPTIQQNIDELFNVINKMFGDTGKTVDISKGNNSALIFHQNNDLIALEQLSSGEKQLLLILLKVFLMEKAPAILLMDEPEISLHISWQQNLIEALRTLNPQCQIILSTHSPSIFAKGWGEKITYMEDLY
ncbi:AAA family ATPase [Bacteroides sp.]